jgi:7-cyano-7-deazaguanine synthase in queuosine biosynthesis
MRHILNFSGGLDSVIGLIYVLENYAKYGDSQIFDLYSFYYKQTNAIELVAAKNIINELEKRYNVKLNHTIVDLSNIVSNMRKDIGQIPYYTLRNMLFVTLTAALGTAKNKMIGSTNLIYIFVNRTDAESGFADTTHEFITDLKLTIKNYEKYGVNAGNLFIPYDRIEIITPFIDKYKSELIKEYADKYKDLLENSWSCYDPIIQKQDDKYYYIPCEKCLACRNRLVDGKQLIKQNHIVLDTDVETYLKQLLNS